MYDQKPTTSLMEDLQVLGLVQADPKDKRKLAEHAGEMEPDPSMAVGAHDEPDGDEPAAAAPPAPAPKGPPVAPKGPPKAPPFPSTGAPVAKDSFDAMAPGGAPPAPAPAPAPSYDAAPDDEMAAYESAWDCIKQYYALNERKEKLSEDDYKTVVNAMSYVIETQAKFLEAAELDKNPNELPGGTNPAWAGKPENNPSEKVQGTNAMRKLKGWKYHDASPREGEKAESLNALVGELKSLTQKHESNDEMQELGASIIEGFEAIRDTATEVAQSLAAALKESNEKVTSDNPSVKLGKYFEGVAGDAKLLLKAISERETTDVDDAIEDLNSLARDLKRGLGQLN